MDTVVRSAANPTLKYVRSLQRRKTRWSERAFVVEGARAVADALSSGGLPALLLSREGTAVPTTPAAERVRHVVVADKLFDALADTVTPQGVLAVFPFPNVRPAHSSAPLFLILDRLRDPGNAGTLLRAAAGAGVTAVYLTPESVDPYNPKVVRAAMGAHFRIPVESVTAVNVQEIAKQCPLRVVADSAGSTPYDALDWTQPAVLIVGSEVDGISDETRRLASTVAAIPMATSLESLNAAVAGAVILFEVARQRRSAFDHRSPSE